jgi:hypothetical protein
VSNLYRWPNGWRYVPPPTHCPCGAVAVGLITWTDKMGRSFDFAGCAKCGRDKRSEIEKQGFKYVLGRLGKEEVNVHR